MLIASCANHALSIYWSMPGREREGLCVVLPPIYTLQCFTTFEYNLEVQEIFSVLGPHLFNQSLKVVTSLQTLLSSVNQKPGNY